MINKHFVRDFMRWNGEIDIFTSRHLEITFDKDFFGVDIEVSLLFRIFEFMIGNFRVRIY